MGSFPPINLGWSPLKLPAHFWEPTNDGAKMSRLIFTTLISLFIGSTFLGLAGCASDDGRYVEDAQEGHHKSWRERAFERHTGGTSSNFTADEILSGQ
jgi:hypothetical protein